MKYYVSPIQDFFLAGESPIDTFARNLSVREKESRENGSGGSLHVPALASSDSAHDLILRSLKTGLNLEIDDPETRRLVSKIAFENISLLSPQAWSLVYDHRDLTLYEALAKKFPQADRDDDGLRKEADTVYLFALAALGKIAEAIAFLNLPETLEAIAKQGVSYPEDSELPNDRQNTVEFLYQALEQNPNLPFWNFASAIADELDQKPRFMDFLKKHLTDSRITDVDVSEDLDRIFLSHLLESGQTDDAVGHLTRSIATASAAAAPKQPALPEKDPFLRPPSRFSTNASGGSQDQLYELLLKSVQLGRLLSRPELVAIGIEGLSKNSFEEPSVSSIEILLEHNQAVAAEKLVAERLVHLTSTAPPGSDPGRLSGMMILLAMIYDRAGRHEEVIQLLERSIYWSARDLADLSDSGSVGSNIHLIAARALSATGKKEQAITICRRFIENNPGNDAAYEILVNLNDAGTEAFLDQIATKNRFEERPLIWKAVILNRAANFPEAEKIIRQAIAIDPSDGEQGKGNRMRAYAVLSEILKNRGDLEQSEFFQKVVAAIRQSENADDWENAGMPATAIKLYEKALLSFADAYCIQSRLAHSYSQQGDLENAAKHYQRSFELMPDSFGRIESHCFGCEGTFTESSAQKIADKVFTALSEKPDAKPQVFYLLGYLRESQNRNSEAVDFYQKAVALDPDYINAWNKLSNLAEQTQMPVTEKDDISFAIFRLSSDLSVLAKVTDLARLWQTILEFEKAHPKISTTTALYPLIATMDRLKNAPESSFTYRRPQNRSPREAFSQHPLIEGVGELIDARFE